MRTTTLDRFFIPQNQGRMDIHHYSTQVKAHYPRLKAYINGILETLSSQQPLDNLLGSTPSLDCLIQSAHPQDRDKVKKLIQRLGSNTVDRETGIVPRDIITLCLRCIVGNQQAIHGLLDCLLNNLNDGGGCMPGIINRLYMSFLYPRAHALQQELTHISHEDADTGTAILASQQADNTTLFEQDMLEALHLSMTETSSISSSSVAPCALNNTTLFEQDMAQALHLSMTDTSSSSSSSVASSASNNTASCEQDMAQALQLSMTDTSPSSSSSVAPISDLSIFTNNPALTATVREQNRAQRMANRQARRLRKQSSSRNGGLT